MKKKIFISYFEYPDVEIEKKLFKDAGFEVFDFRHDKEVDISGMAEEMDALLVQYVQVNRKVIDRLKNCKIIVRYGIGYDNIDANYAADKGIVVCNVPDYSIDEVADHTISLILALSRGLNKLDRSIREGKFGFENAKPLYRIKGKTLGIIGFGRISRLIVKKVRGFDFNVIVYDPYVDDKTMNILGAEKTGLEEIFARSDFIAVNCPLTDNTKHLVNEQRLKKMKKTAYLINTARGSIVDEKALINALKESLIAGAGLDVFEQEPLSNDNPLLKMENVILTPHCGWYTEDSIIDLKIKAAQEIIRVLNGDE
ncbi:MAG: C-terminal binding protein, partial [Actinobacteria bacterium]|nr:C-terminal binding protein [Actinomycetota bacterium]